MVVHEILVLVIQVRVLAIQPLKSKDMKKLEKAYFIFLCVAVIVTGYGFIRFIFNGLRPWF